MNRYQLFNMYMQVALSRLPPQTFSWQDALAIIADAQDKHIEYNITSDTATPVTQKVTEYLLWKLNGAAKPFWFVKEGE